MAEKKNKFPGLAKPGTSLATEFFETGNIGLDMAVSDGRGIPVGGVVTMYAAPGAGKSTTCVDVTRRLLKKWHEQGLDYKVLYIDGEKTNDLMHGLGLEQYVDDGTFLYHGGLVTFSALQEYCDAIIDGDERLKDVKLIIIDSLQSIACGREMKGDLESGDFGDAVRYRNRFYKTYLPQLKAQGVSCIFVSQQRKKQAVMNPHENPNKSALTDGDKHYADVLLCFSKSTDSQNPETKKYDIQMASSGSDAKISDFFFITIKIDSDKNRYGVRGEVKTLIRYGYGCDNWWILHNILKQYKHLRNKGSAQSPNWVVSDELNSYIGNSFPEGCDKTTMKSWLRHNMTAIKDFLKSRDEYHNLPDKEMDEAELEEV